MLFCFFAAICLTNQARLLLLRDRYKLFLKMQSCRSLNTVTPIQGRRGTKICERGHFHLPLVDRRLFFERQNFERPRGGRRSPRRKPQCGA
jgi:hypothetical protein